MRGHGDEGAVTPALPGLRERRCMSCWPGGPGGPGGPASRWSWLRTGRPSDW